ncbi:MAG: hypothetical protein ACYCX4_00820 [Bacillota bacterium]
MEDRAVRKLLEICRMSDEEFERFLLAQKIVDEVSWVFDGWKRQCPVPRFIH